MFDIMTLCEPIGPGSGYTFHSLFRDRFLNIIVDQHCDFKGQGWTSYKGGPWSPVVGESDPIHKPERKVNGCL